VTEAIEEGNLDLNRNLGRLVAFLSRRRWWIFLPFCCVVLITAAVLKVLPNRYTSKATLLVVQQQVPQRYVVPNSTTDIASALQAMKQEVLSRTQLLRMINDFGLYPKKRKHLAPEELIAVVMSDIDIVLINDSPSNRDVDSFQISFTAEDAVLAQQVTNTLTSLFINEYLRTGAEHATNTTNFLHQAVVEKGRQLEAQEERLRDFKLHYVGELPEQQQGNLGILTGLQGQLQNTMSALNRAEQQRALLQAQLQATPRRRSSFETGALSPLPATPNSPLSSPVDAARNELYRLEIVRYTLLGKGYTPQHPDVMRNQEDIAQAEARLRRLREAAPPPDESHLPAQADRTASEPPEDPAVVQLKASIDANRLDIETLSKEETRLKAAIGQYENRINATPVREQQVAGILRDTELLRQEYGDLLKKEQESQLATDLEKKQGGQQFRLIDPASLPNVPSSPQRVKISVGGAFGGLCLGLALAIFMELKDTSFYTEEDLTDQLSPRFTLGVPLLLTPREERRRKWQSVFQWLAASAGLLAVASAQFYVLTHR
jgi:polysaccharide biosynthesis transport protein